MALLLYTDPGSGMMLLQIILAFGASALFYFRKNLRRLMGRKNVIDDLPNNGSFVDESPLNDK